MKVARTYVGQEVRLTWADPSFQHWSSAASGPPPKGRAALSKQVERGLIDDVSEGVVRIVHTETTHPGETQPGAWSMTWVPEESVTEIVVLVPQAKPVEGGEHV